MTRGCGTRKPGTYLSCPLSPIGRPFWTFVQDPPIPYPFDKFQGVHPAEAELVTEWPDDKVLLVDMVGMQHYAWPAHFVEEFRRQGISRRIPCTFDFSLLAGKEVYLGLIHWRAIARWPESLKLDYSEGWHFRYCAYRSKGGNSQTTHYPECVWQQWLVPPRTDGECVLTYGDELVLSFDPLNVVEHDMRDLVPDAPLPVEAFEPGIFLIVPIPELDVVGVEDEAGFHAPETNAEASGLTVNYVTE